MVSGKLERLLGIFFVKTHFTTLKTLYKSQELMFLTLSDYGSHATGVCLGGDENMLHPDILALRILIAQLGLRNSNS